MSLPVSLADVQYMAKNGSPALLAVAGRAFGLGTSERDALFSGEIPWWTMLLGGAAIGFFAGARVTRKWPEKVPSWVKGK